MLGMKSFQIANNKAEDIQITMPEVLECRRDFLLNFIHEQKLNTLLSMFLLILLSFGSATHKRQVYTFQLQFSHKAGLQNSSIWRRDCGRKS